MTGSTIRSKTMCQCPLTWRSTLRTNGTHSCSRRHFLHIRDVPPTSTFLRPFANSDAPLRCIVWPTKLPEIKAKYLIGCRVQAELHLRSAVFFLTFSHFRPVFPIPPLKSTLAGNRGGRVDLFSTDACGDQSIDPSTLITLMRQGMSQ
jgi:hypothetical protein